MIRRPPRSTLFPYTRSSDLGQWQQAMTLINQIRTSTSRPRGGRTESLLSTKTGRPLEPWTANSIDRSEEHTSELQSQSNLVCRLLLEKKKQCRHPHSSAHPS